MANEKQTVLSEEYLRKFRHRAGYRLSESPKYRPLVEDGEEFDNIPMTNEAGEQEDAEIAGGGMPPTEPSNDQPIPAETPADVPAPAEDPNAANPMGADMNQPAEPEVDDIQNEIIKHNIEAMKSIRDKLENLDSTLRGLNGKMDVLTADVEEVREPSNAEKLMSKTNVSYPYYFNLNDFWKGNWFDEKREQQQEKGIKELPDGTYVADFDDLPQKSKIDVQNSFNELNESNKKRTKLVKEGLEASSQIDGRNKRSAINLIYKSIDSLIMGTFRDNSWENVKKIWDRFGELGLDWDFNRNPEYYGGMPPQGKIWYFEIRFTGDNGRPQTINGNLTAAGAGSVQDPLDKYDISVVLS